MKEYFCAICGLFHWFQHWYETRNGLDYYYYTGCPNPSCKSQTGKKASYSVESYAYAYFYESCAEYIKKVMWSSPKYAPENALKVYKKQGIRIVD